MGKVPPLAASRAQCCQEAMIPGKTPAAHLTPPQLCQTLPGNGGHEGLQLLGLIGTREGPAHVAGGVSNVGAHTAGTPLLLIGQRLQDHGDNWAQETKTVSTGTRGRRGPTQSHLVRKQAFGRKREVRQLKSGGNVF